MDLIEKNIEPEEKKIVISLPESYSENLRNNIEEAINTKDIEKAISFVRDYRRFYPDQFSCDSGIVNKALGLLTKIPSENTHIWIEAFDLEKQISEKVEDRQSKIESIKNVLLNINCKKKNIKEYLKRLDIDNAIKMQLAVGFVFEGLLEQKDDKKTELEKNISRKKLDLASEICIMCNMDYEKLVEETKLMLKIKE